MKRSAPGEGAGGGDNPMDVVQAAIAAKKAKIGALARGSPGPCMGVGVGRGKLHGARPGLALAPARMPCHSSPSPSTPPPPTPGPRPSFLHAAEAIKAAAKAAAKAVPANVTTALAEALPSRTKGEGRVGHDSMRGVRWGVGGGVGGGGR